MKKLLLLVCVASLFSCTKRITTVITPTTLTLSKNNIKGDTLNFRSNINITYSERATAPINSCFIDMKGAVVGNEINILTLVTKNCYYTVKASDTSIKQIILVNGMESLKATSSTKWVINIKYFSKDFIFLTISNPVQP